MSLHLESNIARKKKWRGGIFAGEKHPVLTSLSFFNFFFFFKENVLIDGMRTAPKVKPLIFLCSSTTSEVDMDVMTVEVEPS